MLIAASSGVILIFTLPATVNLYFLGGVLAGGDREASKKLLLDGKRNPKKDNPKVVDRVLLHGVGTQMDQQKQEQKLNS